MDALAFFVNFSPVALHCRRSSTYYVCYILLAITPDHDGRHAAARSAPKHTGLPNDTQVELLQAEVRCEGS